jgi:D-tyrosyl-tRNA(Tyr) deacylase
VRAVLQRVTSARVRVDGAIVGEIGRGLLVLLGVARTDTAADAATIATKIASLRVFDDEAGKMNLAVGDVRGAVLIVSQFTLLGDCRGGRRPSYIDAAPPETANALYEAVVDAVRQSGLPVATGVFRAHMAVELVNDGPVTLILESPGAPPAP